MGQDHQPQFAALVACTWVAPVWIEEENLESIFSAAPPELWRMFAEARDFADRPMSPPISNVDSLSVREAVASGI